MERLKIALGAVVVLTVLIGCVQKKTDHHKNVENIASERQDVHVNNYDLEDLKAYNVATQLVVERLQEPRTAEFPPTRQRLEHIGRLGDKKYRIDSWVDSQDTYGAMTRKRFSLIFNINHSGITEEKFEIEGIGKIPEVKYHRK